MKQFFKENKNILFICTYVVLLLGAFLYYENIYRYFLTLLGLLKPFFLGIGIAFVLNIPMRGIESGLNKVIHKESFIHRFIRTFAILMTLIMAGILFYLLAMILMPKVTESLLLLFKNINTFVDSSIRSANEILQDLHIDAKMQDIPTIKELQSMKWQDVLQQTVDVLGGLADWGMSNAVAFTNAFFQWFLAFCLSIYMLSGKEKFIAQTKKVILSMCSLETSEKIFSIGKRANYTFTMFVGGQLVDCAIKGIMFYIVLLLLDYPFPELSATIITIFSIVPVFGPIFAMMIVFVIVFAFDPVQALWFIVIFQVLSNLESQIVYPKIVGKSIGLPGIWVLLSIFTLGDLFGIAGMLLAVPVTALVYELYAEYVKKKLKQKKIRLVDNVIIKED